jgi:hypothetical protein
VWKILASLVLGAGFWAAFTASLVTIATHPCRMTLPAATD